MPTFKFTDPLRVEALSNGRDWRLLEDLHYPGSGGILVPAGFVTDFASVPRALWWLYPPYGRYGKAAVVHDFLYRKGGRSRAEADAIFLEGMRVLGVWGLRRWIIYLSVRAFGWASWRGGRRG